MKIYNGAQQNCQFPLQSEKLDGDEHSDSGARRREKTLRPRWRRVEGEKKEREESPIFDCAGGRGRKCSTSAAHFRFRKLEIARERLSV